MTDAERHELIVRLRNRWYLYDRPAICDEAADELEFLAERLRQSVDASAGLIEAAEWHEEKAKKFRGIKTDSAALITQHHHLAATYFRTHAADRSGK